MPASARLLLPTLLTLLSACAMTPPSTVDVDSAKRCPLELHAGQTLVVTLPSNPTTGLRWSVSDAAPGVLQSLGPEVYTNPEDADIVGAAGLSTWRFKVTGAGEGRLKMRYQRPWETDAAPEQTFDCAISVK
jgi:inhibitor of cysteine peptidase